MSAVDCSSANRSHNTSNSRDERMRRFVQGMFAHSPGEAYLARLTEAALRTPPEAAALLSSYPILGRESEVL